jgi:hypothetical protein
MLLAVLDLATAGRLVDNRIEHAPALLERYRRFFDAVRTPGDPPIRASRSSTSPDASQQ